MRWLDGMETCVHAFAKSSAVLIIKLAQGNKVYLHSMNDKGGKYNVSITRITIQG